MKISVMLLTAFLTSGAFASAFADEKYFFDTEEGKKWQADWERHWEKNRRAEVERMVRESFTKARPLPSCYKDFYDKASGVIGDNAKNYVWMQKKGDVDCHHFSVRTEEACQYLSDLEGLGRSSPRNAITCNHYKEISKVVSEYADVIYTPDFTPALEKEYWAKVNYIDNKFSKAMGEVED